MSLAALAVASGIVHGDALVIGLVAVVTGLVLLARLRRPVPATIAVGALFLVGLRSTVLVAPLVAFSAGRSLSPAITITIIVIVIVIVLLLPALCGLVLGRRRTTVCLLAERDAWLERVRSLTAAQARLEGRARIAGTCTTCWATLEASRGSVDEPRSGEPGLPLRGLQRRSCRRGRGRAPAPHARGRLLRGPPRRRDP